VPRAMDVAKTDSQRKILDYITSSQLMGRPLAGPPNLPRDRLDALRAAFAASVKDPELLEEAAAQRIDIDPIDGQELQGIVENFFTASPEVREGAKAAIGTPTR
jgi:tripartite-type tricarboxylate transporter receptor subunit TctC